MDQSQGFPSCGYFRGEPRSPRVRTISMARRLDQLESQIEGLSEVVQVLVHAIERSTDIEEHLTAELLARRPHMPA